MTDLPYLNYRLECLRSRLNSSPPDPGIIDDAIDIMRTYSRVSLPDWVEIIANGNPDALASVVEVAKSDIEFEEGQND